MEWLVNLGGVRSPITRADDGRLLVPVAPLGAGLQVLQLVTTSGPQVPPVLFQVDQAAPVITSELPRVRAGERVSLTVTNLLAVTPEGVLPGKDDIEIRVAGVSTRAEVMESLPAANSYRIEFVVPADAAVGDAQAVSIAVGTRVSAPAAIAIN